MGLTVRITPVQTATVKNYLVKLQMFKIMFRYVWIELGQFEILWV